MRIKIDNDMKRIFTLMLLSLAVVMGGCEKDNTYEDPGLDVSLYNIAGVWKLATWNGGTELAEGSYVYVELSYRDGNTFTIYQNLDSFGPRRITGSYSLYTDDALGPSYAACMTTRTATGRAAMSSATCTRTA